MKKSVAITAVLSLHVAVIGLLLAQAGCSSDSGAPEVARAKTTVSELNQTDTLPQEVDSAIKDRDNVVLPPEGSRTLRADPTRPAPEETDINAPEKTADTTLEPIAPKQQMQQIPPAKPEPKISKPLAVYTVKKGDNLTKIAKTHNVGLQDLMDVNGLSKSSTIKIGQQLKIPENGIVQAPSAKPKQMAEQQLSQESEVYVVVRGDSLSRIAQKRGMTVKQLMAINNLSSHNIRIGQKLYVAKAQPGQNLQTSQKSATVSAQAEGEIKHTVSSGETLGAIAIKYGSSVKAIAERNNIADPRKIKIGQVLIIRSSKSPSKVQQADSSASQKPAEQKQDKPAGSQLPPIQVQKDDSSVQVLPSAESAPLKTDAAAGANALSPSAQTTQQPAEGTSQDASSAQNAPEVVPTQNADDTLPVLTF